MSWVAAKTGVLERLQSVTGLASVGDGFPTSVNTFPYCFFYFTGNARTQLGQLIANKYAVEIQVIAPWVDWQQAENDLAPFVNRIPAAFDATTTDPSGQPYATLGGRVNLAQLSGVRATETDRFINIGGVDLVRYLFDLVITDKAPTGSGV